MTRRNAGPVYLLEIIEVLCLIYVRISAVKCLNAFSSKVNRFKSNSGRGGKKKHILESSALQFRQTRSSIENNLSKLANILMLSNASEHKTSF